MLLELIVYLLSLTNQHSPGINMEVTLPTEDAVLIANAEFDLDFSFDVMGWVSVRETNSIDRISIYEGNDCNGNLLAKKAIQTQEWGPFDRLGFDFPNQFSLFSLPVPSSHIGLLTFTTCARQATTEAVVAQVTRSVHIVRFFIEKPSRLDRVTPPFEFVGWVVGIGSNSADLVVNSVKVYTGDACNGTLLGKSMIAPGYENPDSSRFEWDQEDGIGKFAFTVQDAPPGRHIYTDCFESPSMASTASYVHENMIFVVFHRNKSYFPYLGVATLALLFPLVKFGRKLLKQRKDNIP